MSLDQAEDSSSDVHSSISGTIRDLLADAKDNDEVDWSHLLEALDTKANAAKDAIQDVLTGHHPQYVRTFACSKQVGIEINRLRGELNHALRDGGSEDGLEGSAVMYVSERNNLLLQLKRLEHFVSVLEALYEVQLMLEKVDEELDKQNLGVAAENVEILQNKLNAMVQNETDFIDTKIYRAIRVHIRRKRAKLQSHAEALVRSSIFIDENEVKLTCKNVNHLYQALTALDTLGVLKTLLQGTYGPQLLQNIILPLARFSTSDTFVEINPSSSKRTLRVIHDQENPAEGTEINRNRSFENLRETFKFLRKELLNDEKDWMEMLGPSVWGTSKMIERRKETKNRFVSLDNNAEGSRGGITTSPSFTPQCLAEALLQILIDELPDDMNALEQYQQLANNAREFEHFLASMDLISDDMKLLEPFLNDLNQHLAEKRRASLLVQARQFILKRYMSGCEIVFTKNGGSQALANANTMFRLDEMEISCCTRQLLEQLAYVAMDEATRSTNENLCLVMYKTCRDVVELFQTLVPFVYEKELSSMDNSRPALLFHNDCLFLAHHMLVMGHIYHEKFPPSIQAKVITVDMVPTLRETGAARLKAQVQNQIDRISHVCFNDGKSSDSTSTILSHFADCTTTCANQFTDLTHQWKSILARTIFTSTANTIGNALLGEAIDFLLFKLERPSTPFFPNDFEALRGTLQKFNQAMLATIKGDGWGKETDTDNNKKNSSSSNNNDTSLPNLVKLEQIVDILEQLLTIHIFRNKVSMGDLSSLTQKQIKTLETFLFPGEE